MGSFILLKNFIKLGRMNMAGTPAQSAQTPHRYNRRLIIGLTSSLFLLLFIALLAFFLWRRATVVDNPLPLSLPNGIAAGDVTQDSAVLWAHSLITGVLTFNYG